MRIRTAVMLLVSACSMEVDVPRAPLGGVLCAPGASYVCPCGDETWSSAWKSGTQHCSPGLTVTRCDCSDGGAR